MKLAGYAQLKYKQTKIKIPVFKDTVPLVKQLWRHDLYPISLTYINFRDEYTIEFLTIKEAEKFLTMLARVRDLEDAKLNKNLYQRIVFGKKWEVIAECDESSINLGKKGPEFFGPPKFNISISIRFPKSDYETVMRLIKQSKTRKKK